MQNNFSILVNTTDTFNDCWVPFFKLFKKYWPNYDGKIYLNTETKDFQYGGLNIIAIKNQLYGATWSKCLKFALKFINEDLILYLQDDYFINDFVDHDKIEFYISEMMLKNIDCIHLTSFASNGPFEISEYKDLLKFKKKAAYKISTQASLWRKSKMDQYLKVHESGWHFEIYGTKRAHRNDEQFYIIKKEEQNKAIIPYKATGIIKGKWYKDAVYDLFEENDINLDYSKRGFYDRNKIKEKKKFTLKKIINRIKSIV